MTYPDGHETTEIDELFRLLLRQVRSIQEIIAYLVPLALSIIISRRTFSRFLPGMCQIKKIIILNVF